MALNTIQRIFASVIDSFLISFNVMGGISILPFFYLCDMLDKFQRRQKNFKMHHMFPPNNDGMCSCGCGNKLSGRQTRWASKECADKSYAKYAIINGDTHWIRKALFEIDMGACRSCGEITSTWEADHILPVHQGGGGCGLDNLQTLCKSCHKEKTFAKK